MTGVLYVKIPKGFFPEQDTGFIFGQAEARQDTSFAAVAKIEHQFADVIAADPAVFAVVGFAGATGGNSSETTARAVSSSSKVHWPPTFQVQTVPEVS